MFVFGIGLRETGFSYVAHAGFKLKASLALGIYIPHAQLENFFFKDRQKMNVLFASLLEQVNFNFKVFTSLILSKILATSTQCSVTICLSGVLTTLSLQDTPFCW